MDKLLLDVWQHEHPPTRADVVFGVRFERSYDVTPDPAVSRYDVHQFALVVGHSRGLMDFVAFPHLCPGSDCAIARWIRRDV